MGLQEGRVSHRKWQLIRLLESRSSMHFCWQRRPGLDKGLLQGHQQVPSNEKASYFPSVGMHAHSVTSDVSDSCDTVGGSSPGSSVHGILQVRILEWAAVAAPRGSSWPRNRTHISCSSNTAGSFFTTEPKGKSIKWSNFLYFCLGCKVNLVTVNM